MPCAFNRTRFLLQCGEFHPLENGGRKLNSREPGYLTLPTYLVVGSIRSSSPYLRWSKSDPGSGMCLWLAAPQLVRFSRPTNALNTLLTFVTRLAGILTSTSSTFLQPCRLASARLQPSMATMEKKNIHYSIASVICGNLRTSASGYTYLARLRKSTKLSMLRYDHTTTQYLSNGQAHKLTNFIGN